MDWLAFSTLTAGSVLAILVTTIAVFRGIKP